ncbi:RNA-directed DNA polymerase, eukaryota, reverse transcriptase zinc-binding domain protein [Tanacetum coccineum]
MGKQSFTTDAKGWTCIFLNNKNPNLRNLDNHYNKDLERIATSFYVSNILESLDAKGLWNACMPYGRFVDAFIANKCSKGGKRFGFIHFLGVKYANEFVRSLSNIWIGNFHLYVAVSLFQGGNACVSQPINRPPAKNENPKTESIPKPESNPNFSYHQSHTTKPSFADVIYNKQKPSTTTHTPDTVRTINLIDNDIITIEDSSTVLLLKLNEATL